MQRFYENKCLFKYLTFGQYANRMFGTEFTIKTMILKTNKMALYVSRNYFRDRHLRRRSNVIYHY